MIDRTAIAPSDRQIQAYVAEAHRLRAETLRNGLRRLMSALRLRARPKHRRVTT